MFLQWKVTFITKRKAGFMSNPFIYRSIFASHFDSFITEKKAKGVKVNQIQWILLEFDKFFYNTLHSVIQINKEDILKWHSTRTNDKKCTIYQKYCLWSQFSLYMCRLGYECYVPRLPRKSESDFIPFIFTHEQMLTIFNTCDKLRMKEHHAKSILIIIPVLLRLLYSTGVRISEALAIRNKDIDFERHLITLNKTKNRNQRLAPINNSLERALKQYLKYRDKIPIPNIKCQESHLFVSSAGKPCARKTVLSWFHKILKESNIPYVGNQQGPRIHDLRHTAAVHSLIQLTNEGLDTYCSLPILSTFIGHRKIHSTEYYLRLTQEIYSDVLRQDATITSGIYSIIRNAKTNTNNGNDY